MDKQLINLEKIFVNDVMRIFNKYNCNYFKIERFVTQFIIIFENKNDLNNNITYEYELLETLSTSNDIDIQFIRDNMTNEKWHDIVKNEFSKLNMNFIVIDYYTDIILFNLTCQNIINR